MNTRKGDNSDTISDSSDKHEGRKKSPRKAVPVTTTAQELNIDSLKIPSKAPKASFLSSSVAITIDEESQDRLLAKKRDKEIQRKKRKPQRLKLRKKDLLLPYKRMVQKKKSTMFSKKNHQ